MIGCRSEVYRLLLLLFIAIPIGCFSLVWAGRLLTRDEMLGIQGGHYNSTYPWAFPTLLHRTVFVGDTVSFNGGGSFDPDGDSIDYYWDFGDGISSSLMNPSHQYTSPGRFTVSLTVTDKPSHPQEGLPDSWHWESDTDSILVIVVNPTIEPSSMSVSDGNNSGEFKVINAGSSVIGYQWSWSAPSGAGNSPTVSFSSLSTS